MTPWAVTDLHGDAGLRSWPVSDAKVVSDLETQITEVSHYFRRLSPRVVTAPCTPSLHPGGRAWTPKDHLSHIVFAERNFHRLIASVLAGDRTPLAFRGDSARARDEYVNRENQVDVDLHRDDELEQLLGAFEAARRQTIRTLRDLEESRLQTPLTAEGRRLSLGQLFPIAHTHARLHVDHVRRALDAASPPSVQEPVLTDGVVAIRPMTLADVEAHVAGDDDEQARWLMGGRHSTLESTSAWVRRNAEAWRSGGQTMNFGVVEVRSGSLAGFVEAHPHGDTAELDGVGPGEVNVAYGLYPAFRGKGYASHAVHLMTSFLRTRGFRQAVIRAHPENRNSIAVAIRCGFSPSGTVTTRSGELLAVFKKPTQAPAPGPPNANPDPPR